MPLIPITQSISIDSDELVESFTRSTGAGGQHVNTTDSAVQLRFDVAASPNLPSEGSRSQALNRVEVRDRLFELIRAATIVPRKRRPTKPSKAAKARRVDSKKARSGIKAARGRVRDE